MSTPLLASLDDGLLTLTLNRPDRRNAVNAELDMMMIEALQSAGSDSSVRAVLLRGAGGTFCVGGDVKAMAAREKPPSINEHARTLRKRMESARLLHQIPKPTMAFIEGAAAGAGLALALACDLRLASASAKITTAFAKVGLSGDFGASYFLMQLVGIAKARELLFSSAILSGTEAQAIGLVHRAAADEEAEKAALAWARSLAQGPTVAFGLMKQNLNRATTNTLEDYLDHEALNQAICTHTADHKEAAKAFVEKRGAAFAGC